MSAALYVVIEGPMEDTSGMDGRALSRHEALLASLALDAGVTPLMTFFGAFSAYAEEFDLPVRADEWFDADEGLRTVAALLGGLSGLDDLTADEREALAADLTATRRLLLWARDRGARWHLAVDL